MTDYHTKSHGLSPWTAPTFVFLVEKWVGLVMLCIYHQGGMILTELGQRNSRNLSTSFLLLFFYCDRLMSVLGAALERLWNINKGSNYDLEVWPLSEEAFPLRRINYETAFYLLILLNLFMSQLPSILWLLICRSKRRQIFPGKQRGHASN